MANEKQQQENVAEEQEKETKSEEVAEAKTEETSDNNSDEKVEKEEAKEISPEEKIEALEKEIAELKTQALYKAAENDNWRKRMMQQKEEAVAYANASLLGDLLDSLDNFDRTLDAAKDAKDAKSIADAKEGDEFNPEEHEAIGRVEEEGVKVQTVKQVYLKGYKLKDKVIRHAKVMVSVPKE